MPPPALSGRGLYIAERGARSAAAGGSATRQRRCAAEPGARVTAAGGRRARVHETAKAAASRGQRSPAPIESPLPGAPAAPHPTLPSSRNLGQVDNSRGGRPTRAVFAARPSPGVSLSEDPSLSQWGEGTDTRTREVLLGNTHPVGDAGPQACSTTKTSTRSAGLELTLAMNYMRNTGSVCVVSSIPDNNL